MPLRKPKPANFLSLVKQIIIPILGDRKLCTVAELEREFDVERRTLLKWMRESAGCTIEEYISRLRLWEFARRLRTGEYDTIGSLREELGIKDEDHLVDKFKEVYKMPPSVYALLSELQKQEVDNVLPAGVYFRICPECGHVHAL